MVRVRFEGGEELARRLNALPAALSQRILTAVLKLAAEPMRARMAQLAPRAPGEPDIADHIGISVASRIGATGGGKWRSREEGEAAVAVGPTKAFFYGLYLEYGFQHYKNSGFVSAQPFMRPAFDTVAPQSLGIIGDELWKVLRVAAESGTTPPTSGGRFSDELGGMAA